MYFNNDNSKTNFDDEFKNENILSKLLKSLSNSKIIIFIIITIILIFIIIFLFTNKLEKNYLILNGEENIILYQGTDYIEPGYNAYNSKDEDLTNDVIIDYNVNTDKIGEYIITYTIGNINKTRKITIIEKPESYTSIYLKPVNNSINIYLEIGDKYEEPGYQVFSSFNEDLNNKVKVTGTVNTSKEGNYKLTYSVTDPNGVTITTTRLVVVMNTEINLSLSTKEYTNKDISINIGIIDNYFDYILLPDNTKVTENTYSYKVSKNGKYTFKVYNIKGTYKESSIEVKNIDKTEPTGSCNGTYKEGKSSININASDQSGIKQYVINEKTYTTNTITINSELKTVNITIYDKAGNTKNISCNLKNNNPTYDNPINPNGNENIIQNISTNTLKVWIEEYSTYYVSHIWALNPYQQFKSAVPENFGKELKTSSKILTNDVSKRNYQNKVIIAINASGIVLNGVWDSQYYQANPEWNKTSVSPIVIVDGKVLRNFSSGKIPADYHVTYGLKKDGNLAYYKYKKGTNIQSNIETSQKIIDDGVLYTFAFNPVLVLNGKAVSSNTAPNIRQGICQIDKNNFVFITNKANRSTGFSFKSLGEYMVELGCKTGFNVDGGGSASLLLKDQNNKITTIANSSRAIADIIYFHEQ